MPLRPAADWPGGGGSGARWGSQLGGEGREEALDQALEGAWCGGGTRGKESPKAEPT